MVITLIFKLTLGLILLFIGGNYLVEGGVAIAKRFKLSPFVIGMTIVGFGTSAPELIVSIKAAMMGSSGIALGNVIGSNIINIGFILGLTAIICPISIRKKSIALDGAIMLFTTVLVAIFSIFGNGLSRIEGIILFIGIIFFTVLSIYFGKNHEKNQGADVKTKNIKPFWLAIVVILLSCASLSIGADLLVDGAVNIAKSLKINEKIIGLTIVAIGTSLPEFSTSLMAALKKQMDISIGNIIGSNIFNILCVLGVTSTISPITFNFQDYAYDFIIMFAFSLLLMLLIMPWRNNLKEFKKSGSILVFKNYTNGVLGRVSGVLLVLFYIAYVITLF